MELNSCEHWRIGRAPESDSNAESSSITGTKFPWTGNVLGSSDLAYLSGTTSARLIAIMGAEDAGKTSLLAAMYLLLGRGVRPAKASFAGSLTLEGWENIASSLRWSSPQGPSFPPHTSSGAGRHPGLLHLKMADHIGQSHLLFADAPGEWFARWATHCDATDAAGAKWLESVADVLVVVADSSALAGPGVGVARARLFELLRRVGAVRGGRPMALVWTKSDVNVAEATVLAVQEMANRTLGPHQVFRVSMHPPASGEPRNQGQGLVELFEWFLTVRDQGLGDSVATPSGHELYKILYKV